MRIEDRSPSSLAKIKVVLNQIVALYLREKIVKYDK